MSDLISRQAAIDALDEIRHALWEIDIPSPTVPEYIEHHEQIQSVWKLLDKKQKELYVLPAAQPKQRWILCSERLPKENVYVLVWCGEIKIARIIHGISKEQRTKMQEGVIDNPVSYGWNLSNGYFKVKRSESYRSCDEYGNNKVPYCWDCIYGDMFGQNVKAWMPLPKPYRDNNGGEE